MKIEDYESAKVVTSEAEIAEALSIRYGAGVNEFWLSNGQDKFPSMSIVVKDDMASLSYFPKPRDPGYRSIGSYPGLDPDGFTQFAINTPDEEHEVANDAVVSYASAVQAAQEFARLQSLPSVIEWLEL